MLMIFYFISILSCPAQSIMGGATESRALSSDRPKIGLVLGGGGAKGAAEIGVLKVIEEEGVSIDYISGTSIGAIIGGLYAVGYRAEQLDSLFRSQEWIDLFMDGNFEDVFRELTGTGEWSDFDKLPIPFRCVAVNIQNQQEEVLKDGNLAMAMRASMAIPGVFSPVSIDGKTLVDGGMMNNLPVDVVKKMGADIVIAIDLTQKKHETRNFSLKEWLGIGGILDWAVSRPDWKKYNDNRKAADVYINPKLAGYGSTSFGRKSIEEMIRIGYDTGEKSRNVLRKIKNLSLE